MIPKDLKHFARVTQTKQLGHSLSSLASQRLLFQGEIGKNLTASSNSQTANDTRMNAVIMGRKTWESIPENKRPLAGRLNIILSRNADYQPVFRGNDG